MADLIDRETLRFSRGLNDDGILYVPYGDIALAPSVEAVPVIHAYWRSEGGKKARFCSHCNHDEPYKFADKETDIYAYCPHCGSRMDGNTDGTF